MECYFVKMDAGSFTFGLWNLFWFGVATAGFLDAFYKLEGNVMLTVGGHRFAL